MSAKGKAAAAFASQKNLVIESYRKNGEPVRTAVNFIEIDGMLYVRTGSLTGKIKRIRRNPKVKLAPSNREVTVGEWVEAEATIATGEEKDRGLQLLKEKNGERRQSNDGETLLLIFRLKP